MSGEGKRTIKLFCPSLSKLVSFVAWEEQKLDLGFIARTFGLEPVTLKLNGHFISRGVDLIAYSVTWKSLLSFFSSRGLSTGASDTDALIVDGKLSKLGTKRAHVPDDIENQVHRAVEPWNNSASMVPLIGDASSLKKKRPKQSSSEHVDDNNKTLECNQLGLKRKQSLDNIGRLKRIRTMGIDSGFQGGEVTCGTVSNTKFSCSFLGGDSMKRTREEEMVTAALCKRTR
ncbi:hypothetical protein NMG60_11034513 [Bertholletia excelsa]